MENGSCTRGGGAEQGTGGPGHCTPEGARLWNRLRVAGEKQCAHLEEQQQGESGHGLQRLLGCVPPVPSPAFAIDVQLHALMKSLYLACRVAEDLCNPASKVLALPLLSAHARYALIALLRMSLATLFFVGMWAFLP